jgi:DNA polymerase III delta prime subunit
MKKEKYFLPELAELSPQELETVIGKIKEQPESKAKKSLITKLKITKIISEQIKRGESINFRPVIKNLVKGRQAEISEATGIRQATISEYINGKREMLTDTLEIIINYCINN